MQRKIFWVTFTVVGLIADLALPFWWAVVARFLLVWLAGGSPTAAIGFEQLKMTLTSSILSD